MKSTKSQSSPLGALVDAVAYGLALKKAWPHRLRSDWARAVNAAGFGEPRLPVFLNRVTVIVAASDTYWRSREDVRHPDRRQMSRWQEGAAVSEKAIVERVETLEKRMDSLRALPAEVKILATKMSAVEMRLTTVESKIVQLRTDMNDGFSATLQIVEASSKATQAMFDETHTIIRGGDEETRRQMRELHEDLVKRLAAIGEARRRPPKR